MKPDVLVVGAGPVGLTLACELRRHGMGCRIIDRLREPVPYCRAIGVTPRTLEVWEDMGVAREMIDNGLWLTGLRSLIHGHPPQDALEPPLDLPYAALGLPQYETERLLARRLQEFGADIERGVALESLEQDADGVGVRLVSGAAAEETRFRYVVGCDGAHSFTRHLLGIPFEGEAYPWPFMLGDVHIDWDLPYGMSFRALRLAENAPPDMFIAIPLPERGRYRVSMLAPPDLVPEQGTDHGIQAEMKGPSLGDLQAIADDLLPVKPKLSDLRWSSIFRISMRLAAAYGKGRVFLAGDAAHIHPPTGGQGMNTGIQDAYNLAWKLALVLKEAAPQALLESYEAERRTVGLDVVERTRRASESYGRERGGKPDRSADTQISISYKGTPWIGDAEHVAAAGLSAGDRAPDVTNLRRYGLGFDLRLFDVLRGTRHVLIGYAQPEEPRKWLASFAAAADRLQTRYGDLLRCVAILPSAPTEFEPGVTLLADPKGAFPEKYGAGEKALLIRPDGYIAWMGCSFDATGLGAQLGRTFR